MNFSPEMLCDAVLFLSEYSIRIIPMKSHRIDERIMPWRTNDYSLWSYDILVETENEFTIASFWQSKGDEVDD